MDNIDDISNVIGLFKNDQVIFNNCTSPLYTKFLEKEDARRLGMSAWYYKFP